MNDEFIYKLQYNIHKYTIATYNLGPLLHAHIDSLCKCPSKFLGLGKKILILPQKISPLNFSFVKYMSSTKFERHEHLSNATLSLDSRPRPRRDWYQSWL